MQPFDLDKAQQAVQQSQLTNWHLQQALQVFQQRQNPKASLLGILVELNYLDREAALRLNRTKSPHESTIPGLHASNDPSGSGSQSQFRNSTSNNFISTIPTANSSTMSSSTMGSSTMGSQSLHLESGDSVPPSYKTIPGTNKPISYDPLVDEVPTMAIDAARFAEHMRKSKEKARPQESKTDSRPRALQGHERFGRYELRGIVAKGGMGTVYRAYLPDLDKVVALKTLSPGRDEVDLQRFLLEARAAAKLRHPNIVSVHDIGQHDGVHYFTMDLIEGSALDDIVHKSGRFKPIEAAEVCAKLAHALHFAHQHGVVHRDIKPGNIIIEKSTNQPFVTDFGLARQVESSSQLTKTGFAVGTPNYMSPEQAAGKKDVDHRADVYGIGTLLYSIVTGIPPFDGPNPLATMTSVINDPAPLMSATVESVPAGLEEICQRAMSKRREDRFQSCEELAIALENCLSGKSQSGARSQAPTLIIIGLLVMTLALTVTFSVLLFLRQQRRQAKVGKVVTQIESALTSGDLSNAETSYSELLRLDPRHQRQEEFDNKIANLKSQIKKREQDREKSRKALDDWRQDYGKRQYETALEHAQRAHKLDQNDESVVALVESYHSMGQHEAARPLVESLAGRSNNSAKLTRFLALESLRKGDLKGAREHCKVLPDSADLFTKSISALAHFFRGETPQALELVQNNDPQDIKKERWFGIARALVLAKYNSRKQAEELLNELDSTTKRGSTIPWTSLQFAYLNLSRFLLCLNNYKTGFNQQTFMLIHLPQLKNNEFALFQVYNKSRQLHLESITKAVATIYAQDPASVFFQLQSTVQSFRDNTDDFKKIDKALGENYIEKLQGLQKSFPVKDVIKIEICNIRRLLQDLQGAQSLIAELKQSDPNLPIVQQQQYLTEYALKNFENCVKIGERIYTRDPQKLDYAKSVVQLFKYLKQYAQGLRFARQIEEDHPNYSIAIYWQAEFESLLGQEAASVDTLERAVAAEPATLNGQTRRIQMLMQFKRPIATNTLKRALIIVNQVLDQPIDKKSVNEYKAIWQALALAAFDPALLSHTKTIHTYLDKVGKAFIHPEWMIHAYFQLQLRDANFKDCRNLFARVQPNRRHVFTQYPIATAFVAGRYPQYLKLTKTLGTNNVSLIFQYYALKETKQLTASVKSQLRQQIFTLAKQNSKIDLNMIKLTFGELKPVDFILYQRKIKNKTTKLVSHLVLGLYYYYHNKFPNAQKQFLAGSRCYYGDISGRAIHTALWRRTVKLLQQQKDN